VRCCGVSLEAEAALAPLSFAWLSPPIETTTRDRGVSASIRSRPVKRYTLGVCRAFMQPKISHSTLKSSHRHTHRHKYERKHERGARDMERRAHLHSGRSHQ
jgi:hypothetical protein